VIDLIGRVTRVSVETIEIVKSMRSARRNVSTNQSSDEIPQNLNGS
jgi:hypothetical protein